MIVNATVERDTRSVVTKLVSVSQITALLTTINVYHFLALNVPWIVLVEHPIPSAQIKSVSAYLIMSFKTKDAYKVSLVCAYGQNFCKRSRFSGRLNGHCKSDEDCSKITNAKCLKNKCICKDNYQRLNGFACGANLEGNCKTDEECMVPNSGCIDEKCQCNPTYLALGITKCIKGSYRSI